jgi:hypothetical protein
MCLATYKNCFALKAHKSAADRVICPTSKVAKLNALLTGIDRMTHQCLQT